MRSTVRHTSRTTQVKNSIKTSFIFTPTCFDSHQHLRIKIALRRSSSNDEILSLDSRIELADFSNGGMLPVEIWTVKWSAWQGAWEGHIVALRVLPIWESRIESRLECLTDCFKSLSSLRSDLFRRVKVWCVRKPWVIWNERRKQEDRFLLSIWCTQEINPILTSVRCS